MDDMMKYFAVIGKINTLISRATTLQEALSDGIKEMLNVFPSDYAIVWYTDEQKETLRPFHFIGNKDFTSCVHKNGQGIVGRVYQKEKSERIYEYKKGADKETDKDFEDIEVSSMVVVPFANKYENLGVIQFVRTADKEPYNDDIADIFEIMAQLIAIGIDDNDKLNTEWKFNEVILSARDITRSFKNGDTVTKVLKGVDMDVYKGEFLVILGESGSGKSTFLNIIGGMDKADSGSFNFMGKEMTGLSQDELTIYRRDNIGFIFQSYNLISTLTAAQNIDLIGELVEDHLSSTEVLEMVGLSGKKNNYPSQLSGGQQQRVSIARALVKKPKLIFADEPTAALDYATSIEVLSVLEKLVKSGTTLVMVTHNEEITRMCDRVVRMRNGRTYDVTLNRHPVPATELVW